MAHVPDLPHLVFPVQPSGSIFVFLINLARLYGLPQLTFKSFWCLRASRKSLFKRFGISASDESHFPNGLAFPHLAKVISRMVWSFRAWRKSFPKWFGVSAHGESYFPNSLELVVAKIWKLTVLCNGHVRLLGHYYSVPTLMWERKNI